MKKLCLLLLSAVLVFSVFAQTEKGYVYLKNGSVLKGKYWYSPDLSKINIESAGNLWIFNENEIDSVASFRAAKTKASHASEPSSKFMFHTEVGFLLGNDDNSQTAPFSFSASVNYAITNKLTTGLGLGVELLDESYMPVFANFQYKFRDSHSTPYLFMRAGYQVALEDTRKVYNDYYYQPWSSSYYPYYPEQELDNKGGIMFNPGVGYQRMYSPSFGMSIAFGYQYHRLHYEGEKEYALDIDYNRLTIKLGIIFN